MPALPLTRRPSSFLRLLLPMLLLVPMHASAQADLETIEQEGLERSSERQDAQESVERGLPGNARASSTTTAPN